jgi:hypothetical protein
MTGSTRVHLSCDKHLGVLGRALLTCLSSLIVTTTSTPLALLQLDYASCLLTDENGIFISSKFDPHSLQPTISQTFRKEVRAPIRGGKGDGMIFVGKSVSPFFTA